MCTYFRGMHWHHLSLNRQCPFLSWWNLSTFSRHWRGPGTFPVALVYRRSGLVVHFGMPKSIERLGSLEIPGEAWRNGLEKSYFVKEDCITNVTLTYNFTVRRYNGRTGLTSIVLDSLQTCGILRIWIGKWMGEGSEIRVILFDTKIHEIVCVLGPLITHINCNTFYWYILHYSLCIHTWCVFVFPKFDWESVSFSPTMFRMATAKELHSRNWTLCPWRAAREMHCIGISPGSSRVFKSWGIVKLEGEGEYRML